MNERRRIPQIDVGAGGPPALAEAAQDLFRDVLGHGRRHYGGVVLGIGDRLSRRWLRRRNNPYLADIDAIAALARVSGPYVLNLSYEWSCTTGVGPDPRGEGARMRRTLDWPLDGLGQDVVVALVDGPTGPYYNVTWPGFVGVATAMAPGRFSAAVNQPPLARRTGVMPLDWAISRSRFWKSHALPPVHLLRRVFDECRDYEEAKRMLCEEPIAVPGFFTLAGVAPDEGCIIEHLEDRFILRESPASIANPWLSFPVRGWERGTDSVKRFEAMEEMRDSESEDFHWLTPPVLNETTRLAVTANAARSRLVVQGFEADGPATEIFSL